MRRSWTRKGLSVLLNAVLLGTFFAVPMLDSVAVERDVAVESEHGSCDYVRIHDHAICVQFGSNQAQTAPVTGAFTQAPQVRRLALVSDEGGNFFRALRLLPPTRAPPRI